MWTSSPTFKNKLKYFLLLGNLWDGQHIEYATCCEHGFHTGSYTLSVIICACDEGDSLTILCWCALPGFVGFPP